MISEYEKAIEFAIKYHCNQVRSVSGEPYILHCLRVAQNVPDNLKVVAVLHDVLEDTSAKYENLLYEFGRTVADQVYFLTRKNGQQYKDYIELLSTNKDLAIIKIADLKDNLRDCEFYGLRKRYEGALQILNEHI